MVSQGKSLFREELNLVEGKELLMWGRSFATSEPTCFKRTMNPHYNAQLEEKELTVLGSRPVFL